VASVPRFLNFHTGLRVVSGRRERQETMSERYRQMV